MGAEFRTRCSFCVGAFNLVPLRRNNSHLLYGTGSVAPSLASPSSFLSSAFYLVFATPFLYCGTVLDVCVCVCVCLNKHTPEAFNWAMG